MKWMLTVVSAAILMANVAVAATYSGGSGTEAAPYLISKAADWITLTNTPTDWDKHFNLTDDIDFAGATLTPIGRDDGRSFKGVFDGKGHVVRNGNVNESTSEAGLFLSTTSSGVIRNLGAENCPVTGGGYVGGLVAWNGGTITSCYTTGAVSGEGIVGGLVGFNNYTGIVMSCYSTSTVTGEGYSMPQGEATGGLVGESTGTIKACYATGVVTGKADELVGGLTGDSDKVSVCFWDMETTGQEGSAGGKGLTTSQMKTISFYRNAGWNAHDWVMTEGEYPRLAWEGLGWPTMPAPEPLPFAGAGTEADPYLIATPANFALLSCHTAILDKHMRLTVDLDLSGVALWPIGDLGPFTGVFDGGGFVVRNAVLDKSNGRRIGLFAHLDHGALHNLGVETIAITGGTSVGGLLGYNFVGTITSCYVTGVVTGSESIGGLVGDLNGGSVTSCHTTCAVTGGRKVGGLVGKLNISGGAIRSCYATGPVTDAGGSFAYAGIDSTGGLLGYASEGIISNSYATGTVTGQDSVDVGGLVGTNSGADITMCYATGTVAVAGVSSISWEKGNSIGGLVGGNYRDSKVTMCYATGGVTGPLSVGGLVGMNYGTVTSCYAAGAVTGESAVGGLVGKDDKGTATSCYWDIEASGQAASVGGEGRTTVEMTYPYAENTYMGWDFTTVWAADTDSGVNRGYPYLRKDAYLPEEGEHEEGEGPGEGEGPAEGETTPVQTPVVQGLTEEQARAQLTAAGFVVQVRYESSDSVPEGQVVRQEPEGGALLAPGETVTLVISSDDAGEGGCCQNNKGLMAPIALIRRLLGDWLLIGVSMGALVLLARRK